MSRQALVDKHRVVIIGAGPAGIRCAERLQQESVDVTVIDEAARSGGQTYRRQPDNFTRPYSKLYGRDAGRAKGVHDAFDKIRGEVDYLPETAVWAVDAKQLFVSGPRGQGKVPFDSLVLCTGAADRILPIKGWDAPGVFSLGGAQIALKSQACSIGQSVAFVGSGPLLYLTAAQYLNAGASVAGVFDTAHWSRRIAALPGLLAQPTTAWAGVRLIAALRRGKVPIYSGVRPLEVTQADNGVTAVRFADRQGRELNVSCDAVALGFHLRPETQLADLLGCEFRYDDTASLWLPDIDSDGRTSVANVFAAGDGVSVLGAQAAEDSGRLAALALLADLQVPVEQREISRLRRRLVRFRRFAQGLSQAFPWPAELAAELPDDAVICRCECITVGELRMSQADGNASELNRAKAFTRVGMGRCQGRYCGEAAAAVVASTRGLPIERVGRLRSQSPVKPIVIPPG